MDSTLLADSDNKWQLVGAVVIIQWHQRRQEVYKLQVQAEKLGDPLSVFYLLVSFIWVSICISQNSPENRNNRYM